MRKRWTVSMFILTIILAACADQPMPPETADAADSTTAPDKTAGPDTSTRPPGLAARAGRIQPADLHYLGAFRLPDAAPDASDEQTWAYGGQAFAYRPDGDPGGQADGCPGSLFGTGHDIHNFVSEISIPAPSRSRNVGELPMAKTLQGFHDVRGGLFDVYNELPRVGMEYLPARAGQSSGKLYLAWGQHFHEEETTRIPTHACCDVDLADPNTQGAWYIANESLYSTNGYLFAIPADWAAAHTGGMTLATGRYRDGGWSGMGPSLFAFAPWVGEGGPGAAGGPAGRGGVPERRLAARKTHLAAPGGRVAAPGGRVAAPGVRLAARTLLRYSNTRGEDTTDFRIEGYQHSDEWAGGAWLTAPDGRSAVAFVGTKGSGYLWYGFYSPAGDGMPCVEQNLTMVGCFNPDGSVCAPALQGLCAGRVEASRGWWSSRWDGQIVFYDPADLAAVADGTREPYEPQPYATLDIDAQLFLNATTDLESIGRGDQRRYRVGEPAYDHQRHLLYVPELFADEAKPVIHVWRVG